jgi:hypothetical protein
MGPFMLAWLVGEVIIVYRSVKVVKGPPGPGQLILSSGIFALLALAAESEQARSAATLTAWGYDLAAFMNIAGKVKDNGKTWNPQPAPPTVIIPNGGFYLPFSDNGIGGASNANPPSSGGTLNA